MSARLTADPLEPFHAATRIWFRDTFHTPTRPQTLGWAAIARGDSTLVLAPTGSGKTLTAFLACLDRLMFHGDAVEEAGCRVLYVSPLKALAADVERNLQVPLAGIAAVAAARGDTHHVPSIAIRTGDTSQADRARFKRSPADILITTPESLYLLLTSAAREALRTIDTIIVDEIHALVPTKRGAHLALSIERLAAICRRRPQRIGLSATQRPLDEVARFLGGLDEAPAERQEPVDAQGEIADEFAAAHDAATYRPVTIVDAGVKKALSLTIEVPVEDMARLSAAGERPAGAAADGDQRSSIWSAIHPRVLELVRAHTSTLVFVNSRRVAERMAGAINELAGETLVRSHHGSIAPSQRAEVEGLLKSGMLRGLVATSSLELGIDMGAVDLVIQVEAPPSVASGLQRIGRGGHRANAVSSGVIFPKFRADLLACAAVARAMHDGAVETTRYPRNPLDILAQQIVAMTSMDAWNVDGLFATIRRAAPFASLGRSVFESVLDMLSGRYPSDEFAELRPRVTWDRTAGTIVAREGARQVAITNGGTIPDRGLFGVFLTGASAPGASRVGELDEEMVFESHAGDVFVLGASSWRIDEITHDRVLVSPAPGQPGKMPFWKGDRAGRPLELGLAIGRLTRDLLRLPPAAAIERLTTRHDLDQPAAENLLQYLRDELAAARTVPDADTIVIERVRDDLGDWRVCVLSPRGGRIHAPWAMAVAAKVLEETGADVETLWSDDGFVVRFPDVDQPPDPRLLLPDPDEAQALVLRQLGATALFAAKFRENAARSLLLPKRRPGMRAPLWQQRKRAADLLAVASRYGSFPVLLETYRECLRDFFDMPALVSTLTDIRSRTLHVVTVDPEKPSPFAASLLFSYVASFIYDGDQPLAERRAQALAVDETQLRELIGDAELRELLDAESMVTIEARLQRVAQDYRAKTADGIHDMLIAIGDLTEDELLARVLTIAAAETVEPLVAARRILPVTIAGEARYIAAEDAARYRDALGAALPDGIAPALLEPVGDPLGDLVLRYARTHAPFSTGDLASRFDITPAAADAVLSRLTALGRIVEGEFRPGGSGHEWVDAQVLRSLRRASLAKLRHEIEPVEPTVLGALLTRWQGVTRRRRGADALLDVIEQLQGAPVAASLLETEILPARLDGYDPTDLDAVAAAGEVIWIGIDAVGDRDGRIALYLAEDLARLLAPPRVEAWDAREQAILDTLASHGASFFSPLHAAAGGGYPAETVTALWRLVWAGLVTNDTFHSLRAYTQAAPARRKARRHEPQPFRARRLAPPSTEGRWTLINAGDRAQARSAPRNAGEQTTWAMAMAQQLLARHGVVTREAVAAEGVAGGFGAVYPVLKALEESGRVRRGYFVAGLGATQFALPGALDLLRSLRVEALGASEPREAEGGSPDEDLAVLAATDPANPYGASLRWPPRPSRSPSRSPLEPLVASAQSTDEADSDAHARPETPTADAGRGPTRSVGATVIIVNGALVGYLARGDRLLLTYLPDDEPRRSRAAGAMARALIERARSGGDAPRGMLLEEIDDGPAAQHVMAPYLAAAGFLGGALGFQATFPRA